MKVGGSRMQGTAGFGATETVAINPAGIDPEILGLFGAASSSSDDTISVSLGRPDFGRAVANATVGKDAGLRFIDGLKSLGVAIKRLSGYPRGSK
jgi:hypothetical protein